MYSLYRAIKWTKNLQLITDVTVMTNSSGKENSDVLVVRKINKEIYKRFRQKALEEDVNIGEALNQAMNCWLAKEERK